MFLTRSEYDRGVNTFSPEGRLFQVKIKFVLKIIVTYSNITQLLGGICN